MDDLSLSVEDIYPLTPVQTGLLFHVLLEPASRAYLNQYIFALRGQVDADAMRQAWQRVVDQHPVLRTAFAWEGMDTPMQVVRRNVRLPWEVLDWRGCTSEAQHERRERYLETERARGFALLDPPLMRLALLRLADDRFELVWSYEHLLLDGWSLSLVLRDVFTAYEAVLLNREPAFRPARPYRDYVAWLQRQDLSGAEAYWRRILAGFRVPTPLGIDRGRGASGSFAHVAHRLPAGATSTLHEVARRQRITPNTLLQGAWGVLLSRYSGEVDIVFGATVSGRSPELAGVEEMVGVFINTLPVRLRVEGEAHVSEWLAGVRARQVEAQRYEQSPLADVQGWSEVPAGVPLFESILVFENHPMWAAAGGGESGFSVEAWEVYGGSHYPLVLAVLPGERLELRLEYDAGRIEAAAAERMVGQMETVLEALAADPGRRLSEVSLLRMAERARVVEGGRGEARPFPRAALVHEVIAERAAAAPDAPAAASGGRVLTYRALEERAASLAARLRARGVGPEVQVALFLDRSVELAVALLAVLRAGGAFVPLDPQYPRARVEYLLEDSRAVVVLTRRALAGALPGGVAGVLSVDTEEEAVTDLPALQAGSDTLAYLCYTSGSTGRPKAAMVSHRSLLCYAEAMAGRMGLSPADRVLQFASPAFDVMVEEVFPTWLSGACVVFPAGEPVASPGELLRVVEAEGVSVMELPTAFWHEWVRTVTEEGLHLPGSLRLVLVGGERVLPERLAQWAGLGVPLLHVFGLTETTVTTTTLRLEGGDDGARWLNLPIGVPLANAEAHVLGQEHEPVPVGVPGELYVGGEAVARGYWARPELTAERYVPHPFSGEPGARLYRTGDRVRRLADGTLEFLGRMDQQVKVRGYRIEPAEIEAVLEQHPAVWEAVVVARDAESRDLRLVAYVAAEVGEGELRVWLRERLPEHMVPAAVVTLERLPLTPNGKVDRAALPAPSAARRAPGDAGALHTSTGRLVAGIWAEVLGVEGVGTDDSFFDIGGNSLLLLRVHSRLTEALGREVPLVELLHHRSLGALAAHLDAGSAPAAAVLPRREDPRPERSGASGDEIAIVGMVGRFPGARGLEEFWRNLRDGVDSISTFSDEELISSGIPAALMRRPDYVRARGILEDADRFDAEFFGISPREATVMNPQHRLMLECAWEALENAGYDPETFAGRVGVFTGADLNRYWVDVMSHPGTRAAAGEMQVNLGNGNAFLPTRVSYRLNLRGPSLNVETACSSSLVAIHMGIRALLSGDAEMVVAGGVSVSVPQKEGYLYREGGILSPTGRCRSYDADARGAVAGEGIGLVVLKRLSDALADGDTIHAMIRGSAVNNDGAAKIGYAAPGRDGQAEVIVEALAAAGVEPETIGYVEGHGSATELGDPVEVEALSRAFRSGTGERQFCALGSVKSNIGHLDTAAGVAGLIKAVLALRHREIPPSLHFERPNPRIDFAGSPFFVNAELRPWARNGTPRRAGVSSFGIGGTNAHVVLEEAPEPEPSGPSRPWQLLVLSARTPTALETATDRLAAHLKACPEQPFADVCHTLRVGRRRFGERRALVCRDRDDAVAALEARDPRRVLTLVGEREGRRVAFLLPGLGDHYAGMARGLYDSEPVFRREVDRCAAILEPVLGLDIREVLFADADGDGAAPGTDLRRMLGRGGGAELEGHPLGRTELAQPAVFVTEYALARCWMEWGVRPAAMIGHSLGEYVAATLAGVFRLEDALALVAERARLIGELPAGAMLAVPLDPAEVAPLLRGGLALAAHNAPGLCTVSGPVEAVAALERELAGRRVVCRRLAASHAFHSPMMDPVAERLAERVRGLRLAAPEIPFVSDVTGTWITAEDALSPEYWTRHLCRTVRFAEGMEEVLRGGRLLLEVGPGRTLGTFALHGGAEEGSVFASLRHAYTRQSDQAFLLETLGRLWMAGADVDWAGFAGEERRRRVPLPTYPFERQRYWVERRAPEAGRKRRREGCAGEGPWVPGWRRTAPPVAGSGTGSWLVLLDTDGVGERLARDLVGEGHAVVTVSPAEHACPVLDTLAASGRFPDRVVDLRPLTHGASPPAIAMLARSLAGLATGAGVRLCVVTRGAHEIGAEDVLDPAAAWLHGLCEGIPRDHPGVACRAIDLAPGDVSPDALLAEVTGEADDAVVALRGARRWVRSWERVRAPVAPPRVPGGTYLFLGRRDPAAPLAERLAGSPGAVVRFPEVDLADRGALRALLREEGTAPVGVVYTPGGGSPEEALGRVGRELAALQDALAGAPLHLCVLQGSAAEP
ncbi:MAG TPA: amino acid adenylation domain-containing protein, partial [Longimicrobiaceae bacterium]|nr:amino acid adenylation domain-containing protein [Longimicrobiaceae bacterium]